MKVKETKGEGKVREENKKRRRSVMKEIREKIKKRKYFSIIVKDFEKEKIPYAYTAYTYIPWRKIFKRTFFTKDDLEYCPYIGGIADCYLCSFWQRDKDKGYFECTHESSSMSIKEVIDKIKEEIKEHKKITIEKNGIQLLY